MTTSFTTSDQFATSQGDFPEEGSNYPSAFGITFTPQVSGIAVGAGGFLLAAYLAWSQVLPVAGQLGELQKQKGEKTAQVESLKSQQVEKKLQEKKAEFEESQKVKEEVLALFTNPTNLDTLLLDINSFVKATNVNLISYQPKGTTPVVVADDSFGELAKDKIQTNTYDLNIEGDFSQVKLFLQYIERLQPLLVIKNLNANVDTKQDYVLAQNQLIVTGQPKLKATITLDAVSIAPPPPPAEGEAPPPPQ